MATATKVYNCTCFSVGIWGFDREGKRIKGVNLRGSGYLDLRRLQVIGRWSFI